MGGQKKIHKKGRKLIIFKVKKKMRLPARKMEVDEKGLLSIFKHT